MRIAWLNQLDLSNPCAGGAERHITEVARRLSARGHEVTVFAERAPGLPANEWSAGIRVVRPAGRVGLRLWALNGGFGQGSPGLPYDVVVHDLSKVLPWRSARHADVPSVVFFRHFSGLLLMREAPWGTGPFFWFAERVSPRLYRDRPVITEAAYTKRVLIKLGVAAERVHVVPPGINHRMFQPMPALRAAEPLLIYVGRLKWYKGVDLLLDSLQIVRRQEPAVRLEVVGTGDYAPALKRRAERLGLGPYVRFRDYVGPDELVRSYARAWVHVQPSCMEGWGLTVIEAAAMGTPTVAFARGGLTESVGDAGKPFLVHNRDGPALADKILVAISTMRLERARTEAAFMAHARQYDWERTTTALEAVMAAAR
jgi:glycosyltransferase involved in cell wall biosynthesis